MGNFNTSAFQYNGRRYNFTAVLWWDKSDPKKSTALDNNHINSFMYTNEINTLYLKGYVEYTDTRGLIDRILDKQFSYLEVNFYEIEVQSDKDYAVETPSKTHVFNHMFYINSVEILDRHENEIKYRLNLMSYFWFQCNSKVEYSNYDTQKEDIIDIIRGILTYVGLSPNPDTFDKVKSEVKINFLAGANDSVATSIAYLLNKMYYYHDRIPQLQYLIYNEHTNKYEMFDVMNSKTWFNMYEMPVTFFKNQIEQFTVEGGINFATVVKFPRTSQHTMINNVKYYDFDFEKNYITDETIGNKTIQKFYNTFYNTGEYDKNLKGLYKLVDQELMFNRYSTYWNNTDQTLGINLYNEMLDNYTAGNTLVVNTAGNILRKPGCLVNISIDRDVKNDTGDDCCDDTQDILNQYKAYEGRWFVTKVQTFLDLRQMKYTQNVICCRNFLMKQGSTCGS